jgi:hypothetical protein
MNAVVDTPMSNAGTPGPSGRAGTPMSRAGSVDLDDGASMTSGRNGGKAKTLRIKRLINGRWETEIVRDPSVIKAYVTQRRVIDEEKLEADELLPSDDESKNERRKKRCVTSSLRSLAKTSFPDYERRQQAQGATREAQAESGTSSRSQEPEARDRAGADGTRRQEGGQDRDDSRVRQLWSTRSHEDFSEALPAVGRVQSGAFSQVFARAA